MATEQAEERKISVFFFQNVVDWKEIHIQRTLSALSHCHLKEEKPKIQ